MISTSDFKKGTRFEFDNAPWQIMEVTVHNPSARGAATLVKVKIRNLVSNQVLQKSFKAGETFPVPDLDRLNVTFLYAESDDLVLMDQESYEQHTIAKEKLGEALPWLTDGFELQLLRYNGEIISVELPASVIATIATIEVGAKGDTASGKVMSRARLDNDITLMVPSYIKEGAKVKVDPTTNAFLSRV